MAANIQGGFYTDVDGTGLPFLIFIRVRIETGEVGGRDSLNAVQGIVDGVLDWVVGIGVVGGHFDVI